MEAKEGERVVISKPVASRPSSFSSVRTFTDLMTDTFPQSNHHDAIIRPKTLRLKQPATSSVSHPRGKENGIGNGKSSDDSDRQSYVVYKPKAKLVSKATVSILANMLQRNPQQTQTDRTNVNQGMYQAGPNLVQKIPPFPEPETSIGDGYNWRKYGQKQVKGSLCPRSYYKCTHPKCPVKKKVERSFVGQVSEIVYQGEHNHLKPSCPLPRRASSSTSSGFSKPPKGSVGYVVPPFEFAVPRSANSTAGTSDSGCRSSQCDEDGGELDDMNKCKRRKNEKQSSEGGGSVESDSLEDGFKWRKYGQKVVGGNTHPRSYYRCTSANCRARKHVERAIDNPGASITTYEGKHNHNNHLLLIPPSSSTLPLTSPKTF